MFIGLNFLGIIFFVISLIIQHILKKRIEQYSQIPTKMTGAEIAKKMLNENGIYDVSITSVPGALTDHYNPLNKTVNLSEEVYNGNNVAAIAVAAHECGHAVQHARGYIFLQMRSIIVPFISISSKYMMWVILFGILMVRSSPLLLEIGIILFASTTIFSFITLPVEINASNRALSWIKSRNIISSSTNYKYAENALFWAAMTYVIAALGSLAELMRLISILNDNKRND